MAYRQSISTNIGSSEKAMEDRMKHEEYQKYTSNIKCWMLINGMWPIPNGGILYRALPIITITSNVVLSIMLFRFAFANITDINLVVKGLSLGTSFISIALKVSSLTFYREKSTAIHTALVDYHAKCMADDNLRYLVLGRVSEFRFLTLIFDSFVNICMMYVLIPLVSIIMQNLNNVQPVKYALPATALYPWKIYPGGVVYILTYIFETYNMLCISSVSCGVDALFGYYIFHITGQLRVLGYQIMNYQPVDDDCEFLHKWIGKFQILKKCCESLQTIYGPIIIWQIITNSIVICTVLFQISNSDGISISRAFMMIGYSISKIIQTYIYSWAGSVLTCESEALTESVYFGNWLEARYHSFRTSILIILAQQPLKIIAAKWITVSVELFIMTLNTAVSYFFLLQTLEEKQS